MYVLYVYYIYTVYVNFVGPEALTYTQTKGYVGSNVDRYLSKPSPNGLADSPYIVYPGLI